MTTEEKAKEFAKNLGCEEGLWLWKMMANFHNSQPPNLDLINQITQLNKENQELKETKDNLKETLIKEVERSLRRLDINIKLEKQLQAAEDRIKE
jgi:hypothetical protein